MLEGIESMQEELISVIDVAKQLGRDKQYIFKIIKRLRISTVKHKNSDARGQSISFLTIADYELIKENLKSSDLDSICSPAELDTNGVFYLIQLEPTHDAGRFKVGFATNIEERLRSHKTAAPLLKLVKKWPCKLLWEKTAIECISQECERMHTEIFRTNSIDRVVERCDEFFGLMPKLQSKK